MVVCLDALPTNLGFDIEHLHRSAVQHPHLATSMLQPERSFRYQCIQVPRGELPGYTLVITDTSDPAGPCYTVQHLPQIIQVIHLGRTAHHGLSERGK